MITIADVKDNNGHDDDWKSRLPNQSKSAHRQPAAEAAKDGPIRGDWLDVLALIIATYQVLAWPMLLLIGGLGLVVVLFFLVFH